MSTLNQKITLINTDFIKKEPQTDTDYIENPDRLKIEIEVDVKHEVVDEPEEYPSIFDVPIVEEICVPDPPTKQLTASKGAIQLAQKLPIKISPMVPEKPKLVFERVVTPIKGSIQLPQKLPIKISPIIPEKPKLVIKRVVTPIKGKFCCDICSKYFASKGTIKHHLRGHSGEKPYKCTTCKNRYANRISLLEHTRIHTGERPYVCKFCQKSFIRKKSVIMHERTHTNEKPYQCKKCDKKFNHLTNLTRHNCGRKKKNKPHKCSLCPKEFGHKKSLMYHLNVHTGEHHYSCDECGKEYSLKCSFQKHKCKKKNKA